MPAPVPKPFDFRVKVLRNVHGKTVSITRSSAGTLVLVNVDDLLGSQDEAVLRAMQAFHSNTPQPVVAIDSTGSIQTTGTISYNPGNKELHVYDGHRWIRQ